MIVPLDQNSSNLCAPVLGKVLKKVQLLEEKKKEKKTSERYR